MMIVMGGITGNALNAITIILRRTENGIHKRRSGKGSEVCEAYQDAPAHYGLGNMPKLTEADKTEIRTIYGNNPGMSYQDVANVYQEATGRKLHRSTILRIIKQRDPVSHDAPSKKRGRRGASGEPRRNTVAQQTQHPVVRERPRTAPLIAGAENQAGRIMEELDHLLQGQMSRVSDVLAAEKDFKAEVAKKKIAPDKAYSLALEMNGRFNGAIAGIKDTLDQMARLQRAINVYVDNRTQNISIEQRQEIRLEVEKDVAREIWSDIRAGLCDDCARALSAVDVTEGDS